MNNMKESTGQKKIFIVSQYEELWGNSKEYDSFEDAKAGGAQDLGIEEDDIFYVGEKTDFYLCNPDASDFLQMALGQHEDDLGDWAESWTDRLYDDKELHKVIEEKMQEITDLIMTKHKPSFFLAKNIIPTCSLEMTN